MIFLPRLQSEFAAGLIARTVARGPFTDVSETGQIAGFLEEVATDCASIEQRLHRIRRSFDFMDSFGADLDARVADLPKAPWAASRLARIGSSASSGQVLDLTNDNATSTLVPAGSVFGRNDGSPVRYVLQADVTVPGSSTVTATGTLTAATLGEAGNAGTGVIDVVQSAPSGITCNNSVAISGGVERETDDELKQRALRHLAGLAGTQPAALLAVATAFKASNGVRIRHASVFADPTRPGYVELMVDDGTGFAGFSRTGQAMTLTVPVGGAQLIPHEMPATEELDHTTVMVDPGGGGSPALTTLQADGYPPWVSICERGQLYFNAAYLSAGDIVYIGDSSKGCAQYNVHTGPIAELQALIEGAAAAATVGNVTAGNRVRVIPPDVEGLNYSINITPEDGYDLVALRTVVQTEGIEYHRRLAPGEMMRLHDFGRYLITLDGIRNIGFNALMADGTTTAVTTDRSPASLRKALRIQAAANIEVT